MLRAGAISIQGIYKQLVEALQKIGLSAVETVGQPFDPEVMDAIMREPTDKAEDGTVLSEFRKGFKVRFSRPPRLGTRALTQTSSVGSALLLAPDRRPAAEAGYGASRRRAGVGIRGRGQGGDGRGNTVLEDIHVVVGICACARAYARPLSLYFLDVSAVLYVWYYAHTSTIFAPRCGLPVALLHLLQKRLLFFSRCPRTFLLYLPDRLSQQLGVVPGLLAVLDQQDVQVVLDVVGRPLVQVQVGRVAGGRGRDPAEGQRELPLRERETDEPSDAITLTPLHSIPFHSIPSQCPSARSPRACRLETLPSSAQT